MHPSWEKPGNGSSEAKSATIPDVYYDLLMLLCTMYCCRTCYHHDSAYCWSHAMYDGDGDDDNHYLALVSITTLATDDHDGRRGEPPRPLLKLALYLSSS